MPAHNLMKPLVAGAMLAAFAAVTAARPQAAAGHDRSAALQEFQRRIGEYAALHRRLEVPLPPVAPSESARAFLLNRMNLASAIKTARPNVRQGDIFTPSVARLFRDTIRRALIGHDAEAMLRDLFREHPTGHSFHPRVYDRYPDWATHEMPVILLRQLPPLPEEMEYRLINHDLVLLDTHADLIIDVVLDAIPRSTTAH